MRWDGKMKSYLLASAAFCALSAAAPAEEGGWISPYTTDISGLSVTVGGSAEASLFSSGQPEGANIDKNSGSGAATLTLGLERTYDSGLVLSLNTAFEIYHDRLSGDNYGSDLVQKVYGKAQTGLGIIEVGMTDGAAFALAVTGPVVDEEATLDNPNAVFFRDPTTGHAFTDAFTLNSAVEPSFNFAKISYYTPRIFGLQIGASYTPSQGKDVLPFVSTGPHVANRQESIWETAVSYSDTFGPFSLGLYGGAAFAHADEGRKTTGHAGLTDWAVGSEIDYPLNDDATLAVGGAYHHTNAYTFDINDVLSNGGTNSAHISAKLTYGRWAFGGEYGDGTADGDAMAPTIGVRGYETAIGYTFNDNLKASLGWQELRYSRNTGVFYNGNPRANMDAVFLHLHLHV